MQTSMLTQKLSLKDRKAFEEAYSQLSRPLAELSFSWIHLWDCYKDVEWRMINGNFCLFLTFEGGRCVWGPILPGNKLEETLKKCFSLCESYNRLHRVDKKPLMTYIPEELKNKYATLENFQLVEQSRDFVYRSEDVISLKGRKYKDKRNKRNFFVKNYEFTTEEYSPGIHKEGCVSLLKRWMNQKLGSVSRKDRDKLRWDVNACRKTLDLAGRLGIKGIAVRVKGAVEGFVFGERTNDKTCTMFFGKTDLKIRGLSQFIYGEFLKRFFSDSEFVNDGEDWGVGYLMDSKNSYNPYYVNRGYTLVIK